MKIVVALIEAIEEDVRHCMAHGGFGIATGGRFCKTCRDALIHQVTDLMKEKNLHVEISRNESTRHTTGTI